ncbi:hypothetical protein D3C84_711350 [compost metagenome]
MSVKVRVFASKAGFFRLLLSASKLISTWLRVAPLLRGLPLRRNSNGEVTGIGCWLDWRWLPTTTE